MRHALAASAVAALLASCAAETPPEAPETLARIESPQALPCPEPDPGNACRADTASLASDFDKALAGDYAAQRNTAYALAGASQWVEPQPIQACAWRLVIVETRPADATFADASQRDMECDRLSAAERDQADEVAQLILDRLG